MLMQTNIPLAGCVAVAMAQIMRYHKYPATGNGTNSYLHQKYGTISADFGATTYNWNNMPGSISEPNSDVAQILFHAGVSVNMNYTASQSGASTYNVANALRNNFRYHNATMAMRDHFSPETDEYHTVLRRELDNGRPFFFHLPGGNSQIGWDGHAVVVDGYNNDHFHINFGWSGTDDGYFIFSGTTFVGGYQFGFNGNSVIQISPNRIAVNTQDSLAMVALYNSTGGAGWTHRDNWLTGPLSTWYGLTIIDGRVMHVILDNNNLTGTIPVEIGSITECTNINLTSNKLTGPIPSQIGNLSKLASLTLSFNNLTGEIPQSVGNCNRLRLLLLNNNMLEGSMPSTIGNLSLLERLSVASNLMTGTFPGIISSITTLKSINLSNNSFSGSLPSDLGNLTALTDFLIANNQFSGAFPESISAWTQLNMFSIDNNLFEGAVPGGIGAFTNLIILNLDNNRFTSLPPEIASLTSLKHLTAKNNRLSGMLTSSIGGLTELEYLDLNDNLIESLPEEIGNLSKLKRLDLTNNRLEYLPPGFGKLQLISDLLVKDNLLVELPYEVSTMTGLTSIYAANNRISELTFGISMMRELLQIDVSNNQIGALLPPLSHLKLSSLKIDHNNLTFEDIAASKLPDDVNYFDSYDFYYRYQGEVKLSSNEFAYAAGDSVGIDIRNLAGFSHPGNIYTWYRNGSEFSSGPVLVIKQATAAAAGSYYCSIENSDYTKLTLTTETIGLKEVQPDDGQSPQIYSISGTMLRIADEEVKLVKPAGVRGEVMWQASADTLNWINLTGTITNPAIGANISQIYADSIIVVPANTALYRYRVTEDDCDPIFSDTLIIEPYRSSLLVDTMLNVVSAPAIVSADGIEVFVPQGITPDDFRLTIRLVETSPPVPDTVKNGPVYDVRLSCGTSFAVPLTIKLKVDSDSLSQDNIDRFMAAWYDDSKALWVPYEDASITMRDSMVAFETDHLTKLTWWEKKTIGNDFTDKFTRNGVTVYYKLKLWDIMGLYAKNQTPQPWHLPVNDPEYETPIMVQDVTQYAFEVMTEFKADGLPVPDEIAIYLDNIDDYGMVGLMGMLNGYLTISVYIEEVDLLKSVIAHEYMHFTQDYFISAHAGNIFWMEANGHLADRMVWDEGKLPVSESQNYLLDSRRGKNNIFESLSNSWDYWDSGLLTQNLFGNVHYSYLAGCFIHYMRSYRTGAGLKPETLLKETSWTGSWKNYLDSYIANHLGSDIGTEFNNYVQYIVEGSNSDFTLLNNTPGASGDPLRYINQAPESFSRKHLLKIPEDQAVVEAQQLTISSEMPYLSARMEQFYNLSLNRSLCITYKRLHTDTANIKVYIARWDEVNKRMSLTDISRTDSSFFFIEAATDENVTSKTNQAFLLFVNKSKSEHIEAGYDLEILPVADFNFLYTLDFYYGNVFDAPIHNFSDGIKRRLLLAFTSNEYDISKVYTDSSFTTTVTKAGLVQEVFYNFRNGNITITENRTSSGPISFDPDGVIWFNETEQTTVSLRDIFLVPFNAGMVSQGAGVYYRQTATTAETISKIVSISNTKTTVYDYIDGHSSTSTYNYTGTDWAVSPGIRMNMQFK
jgi:Leucine-rich repeat (LRR) protein